MKELTDEEQEAVINKLSGLEWFETNYEDLARVVYYFDKARREGYHGQPRACHCLMDNTPAFEAMAKRYAADTKEVDEDKAYMRVMIDLYEGMIKNSEDYVPLKDVQGTDMESASSLESMSGGFIAKYLGLMPMTKVSWLESIVNYKNALMSIDDFVAPIGKVTVFLAATGICCVVINNIRRWWIGEISGKRCAKKITDVVVSISVGVACGYVVGNCCAPGLGSIVGAIVGGIVGGVAANWLCDLMTQYLYGLPKEEALENAYIFLNLAPDATNSAINVSFRRLCLIHHPDKGGKADQFICLQNCMEIIRMSRESRVPPSSRVSGAKKEKRERSNINAKAYTTLNAEEEKDTYFISPRLAF